MPFGDDSTLRDPCQQVLVQRHRPRRLITGTSSDGNFAHPIRCTVPIQGLQKPICVATRYQLGNQRRFAETRSLRSSNTMDRCCWLGMPRPQSSRPRKGLAGPRSSTFYPLIDLCATLQLLQPTLPPAFLFENTAMQTHKDPNISVRDFNVICSVIGQPVLLDAARFGAGAHRLRNFWTNLAVPHHLTCCTTYIHRDPTLFADMWLDPGRETFNAVFSDFQPFYPCNKKNERRKAFPTLVAFPISRACRDLNAGTV